jgi:GlcNAc-P-P-Und epimerase
MTKYLITGGSGFIGSNLIDYLIDKEKIPEADVRVLVPPWEVLENLYGHKLEIVIGDIRDQKLVGELTKGIDIVYHLAAKTVIEGGTYDYYKDTNVDGTRFLLEASAKQKVKKFIYFSSISVYGLPAWKGDMENYDESSHQEPSEPYGKTKLEGEKLVKDAYKRWKMPYIIIRPTTVYGPRDKAGIYQLMTAIDKKLFFYIGDAKNKMDYVFVADLVSGVRKVEKSSVKNENFILGIGKSQTQREIVVSIASALGVEAPNLFIPKFFALMLSFIVNITSRFIGFKSILYPSRVKVLTSNCYFNTSKAAELFGYLPKYQIEEGAKITAKWFRARKTDHRVF